MIIKGKLIQCKREVKEFDKKRKSEEKLFLTLAEADVTNAQLEELKEAFKDSGAKFTPDWLKEFEGYVNLSTKFELPYRDLDKNEYNSIEAGIADGLKWMSADVAVSINVKEGALYPNSIIFLSEGKSFNAFAEFDEAMDDNGKIGELPFN